MTDLICPISCENCEEEFAEDLMHITDDDVYLCPGCWEELKKEWLTVPEDAE